MRVWITTGALLLSYLASSTVALSSRQQWSSSSSSSIGSLGYTLSSSSLSKEIFLLSFDGTIADTTEWRISHGIDLALSVWPKLQRLSVMSESEGNDEWLRTKMKAVSDVMVSRPGMSLSCDYALLARLLIEEQQLDQGRSNGSSGKYASKFHPQQEPSQRLTLGDHGTRPLTVGEITTNWNRGGCLAETLQVKYHIDFENPLPVLQERILDLEREKQYVVPSMNQAILDVLLQGGANNIIVTVGHVSDMPMVRKTLSSLHTPISVVSPDDGSLQDCLNTSREGDGSLKLLAVPTTHGSIYRDVIRLAHFGSKVYIFESSWHALKQGISLYGDNIPRPGSGGMAETIIGKGVQLSLNLPQWTCYKSTMYSKGDVNQQNEAMMNPWTQLVGERELAELLSARIVSSPR